MEKQSILEYEANIPIADTPEINLLKNKRRKNLIGTLASTFVTISGLSMSYYTLNYQTLYNSSKSSIMRNYAPPSLVFNIGLYGTAFGLMGTAYYGANTLNSSLRIKQEKETQ